MLHKNVEKIREHIQNIGGVDFIMYSRNDQVADRISIGTVTKKLRVGYSSFSGIDEKYRIEQMKNCFQDFIECNKHLEFSSISLSSKNRSKGSKCTFSLIFDTEQLGGVRYGLPRILELLNKYDVKATFFITNLMKKVYTNILQLIRAQEHEIGLHGKWHEYLSNFSLEEQRNLVRYMIEDFGNTRIIGANFIGRMNADTIQALIENDIKYFVYPLINYYKFFVYPKLPTEPYIVSSKDAYIWLLPVSVETYGRPWFSIKNMIDSAFRESMKSNRHITILCHPFRDGNLQHIKVTEKLLRYLVVEKEMECMTLGDLVMCY
jgi:peptidoglycan/xylan/chitin deacetylase (PgdA/CDA1 family)